MNFTELLTRSVVALEALANAQTTIANSVASAAKARTTTPAPAAEPVAPAPEAAPATEEAKAPAKRGRKPKAAESAPEPEAASTVTKAEVLEALKALCAHQGNDLGAKALLAKYKANKVSDLPEAKYGEIHAAIKLLVAGDKNEDEMFAA